VAGPDREKGEADDQAERGALALVFFPALEGRSAAKARLKREATNAARMARARRSKVSISVELGRFVEKAIICHFC
jgi:hypothetical protein